MHRIINFFFFGFIILFFLSIFKYYSSNKNIKSININRSNIEAIIRAKSSNLPVLKDDTSNVIEFNSSYSDEIKDNKPRSFWNLFKIE